MKKIVVYFSISGNTKYIAKIIQKQEDCDLIEINVKNPYNKDYNKLLEVAKKEINENFKPEIEKIDISDYDLIYLGTPNWWNTLTPPITTFLSENDFEGKTIIPFITHGGGGNGTIELDLKKLVPKAEIKNPFSVSNRGGKDIEVKITSWLDKNEE